MKRFVQVDFAGMPNIIMNDSIVPELLQENYTVNNLINETKEFFHNPSYQKKLLDGYQKVKSRLGEPGASARTAKHVISNVI